MRVPPGDRRGDAGEEEAREGKSEERGGVDKEVNMIDSLVKVNVNPLLGPSLQEIPEITERRIG